MIWEINGLAKGYNVTSNMSLVDVEDGVGIVTLNRPDKLNAMNRKLSSEAHERGEGTGCR